MERRQTPQPLPPPPKPATIVVLSSPGMGHLIPLAEFAKCLVTHREIAVTFINPTTATPCTVQNSVPHALPAPINHIFLPPVSLQDLPDDAGAETFISLIMLRSLPYLRETLATLTHISRLVALVTDLFGTDAFDVAAEFDMSLYIFCTTSAMSLCLFFQLPQLDQEFDGKFSELAEPLRINGCVPFHGKELLGPFEDRQSEGYKWLIHHAKRHHLAEGIIVNTFMDLEPGAVTTLLDQGRGKPWVYTVGPIVNIDPVLNVDEDGWDRKCLKWLDEQPGDSVLFVSFGSGGTLSSSQIVEVAMGLEMSEQRFLWVVRRPNDKVTNGTYFSLQSQNDPFDFLPSGFLERTKGYGFVVPSWAPQAQVLSHGSIGGFLTHCGWNSILESVVNGLPLIAWPLYAEQNLNAHMLTQDTKVALRPQANENGLIEREEIAKVVYKLMQGKEGKRLKNKMKFLKDAATKALGQDGSSKMAISELVFKWKNRKL